MRSRINAILAGAAVAATLTLAGCGGGETGFERTTTVTEQQAIDAARAAVQSNDSFADSASYAATAKGNGWQINVVDEVSGEERLVIIDGQGEVTVYR